MSDFRLAIGRASSSFATFVRLLKQERPPQRGNSGYRRQVSDSDQVVSRGRELEDPAHQLQASVPRLAQQPDSLQPAEDLFDSFAFLLTNSIARMMGRAAINGTTAAPFVVLRDVSSHAPFTQIGNELFRVISLIGRQSHPFTGWPNNASAASRSVVPLACVNWALTTNPLRFSIKTWPW